MTNLVLQTYCLTQGDSRLTEGLSTDAKQWQIFTGLHNRWQGFATVPDPDLQPKFDAPDRKFAAVAHAHPAKPPIWQAANSKWLNWWQQLRARDVHVEFLCPADAQRFYARKFPRATMPPLPPHQ